MSAGVAHGAIRAVCPTCHRRVRVRRQGATWRMVAHKHRTSSWSGSRDEACPVRDVDAVPLIAAWITEMGSDAKHGRVMADEARKESAAALVRAAALDEIVTDKHRRIAAALRIAPVEAVAMLQAEAAKGSP